MGLNVEKIVLKFNKIYVKGHYSLLKNKLETNYTRHCVNYILEATLTNKNHITLYSFSLYGNLSKIVDIHQKIIDIVSSKNKAILYIKHEDRQLAELSTFIIKVINETKIIIEELCENNQFTNIEDVI